MTLRARVVSRLVAPLIAAMLGAPAALFAQDPPATPQDQPPARIKVAVDVVAVDVQVVDKTGRPVPELGPEKFNVTINGRKRRVISAEQISSDTTATAAIPGSAASTVPKRVIVIAIDCISFDATASRDVIQSVIQFVRRLKDDDYVGLSAYPNGAQINPTTDHSAVLS